MDPKKLLILAEIVLFCSCFAAGNETVWMKSGIPDHKRLVGDLLSKYGSRSVRPVHNAKNPVHVDFIFLPNILAQFGWFDDMLPWNPDDYGGVDRISLRTNDIWMPDLTVYERLDVGYASTNIFESYVIVNYTGYVSYYDLSDITVYCQLNMTLFPFDTQTCEIYFASYNYDSEQLVLSFANTPYANENMFEPNGVWQLEFFLVEELETLYSCCPLPYVEIVYVLSLKRIGNFYVYSIWLPSGLLSSLNIAVFIMHPDSGEKVSLSVSNVLAFILFQQIVLGNMPRSGDDSPIIVSFFSAMIAISCLSVLGSAVVLRLYHHDPKKPVPRIFRPLIVRDAPYPSLSGSREILHPNGSELVPTVDVSGNCIDAGNDVKPDVRVVESKRNDRESDWMLLALLLDKIFLFIAMFAMLGTLLYCAVKFMIHLA